MAPLPQTVALVTGGSGIVGAGVIYAFLKAGAQVIAPVRNEKGKGSLLGDLRDLDKPTLAHLEIPTADLSDPKSVAELGEMVKAKHGSLDHVVTSVGGWWQKGPILQFANLETSYDEMLTEYKARVLSHYMLAKVFVPFLKVDAASSFTFITGSLGEAPVFPDASMITAQVGALMILIRTIQAELAEQPYRVNEFCIGTLVKRHGEADNNQSGSATNRQIGLKVLETIESTGESGKIKVGADDLPNVE
ncbi:hypothetical protein KFL_000770290 [Klebsormidium nitens]|uniref:NAD(P)-binding protein n=1 Tax=Klebsormidium nitens TaxID=105231 RepID=A0A1Y1HXT7_KLENI|nr:hypothetical protein KFL_000770290 [Klebsormidium nitens]|eukprot:GAQ81336.1 hypothetical protein KFL_000770290 [Klebsormidium nitens]